MFYLSPVVKNLLIINGLLYLALLVIGPEIVYGYLALWYPDDPLFMPHQLITNLFVHSTGFTHVLFNMLFLVFFGPQIEREWGGKRFITVYLLAGMVGALFHLGISAMEIYYYYGTYTPFTDGDVNQPMGLLVGASGSVMGILAAFGLMYPNNTIQLIIPPIPIKAKYFVPAIILIDFWAVAKPSLTSTISDSNVANFAHIGGALVGILSVYFFHVRKK